MQYVSSLINLPKCCSPCLGSGNVELKYFSKKDKTSAPIVNAVSVLLILSGSTHALNWKIVENSIWILRD